MSVSQTKAQLVHYLNDDSNKVIALTGKWGTGKSYLWNEVKSVNPQDYLGQSLYVSLFGVKSIDQVKQSLMFGAMGPPKSKLARKAAKSMSPAVGALEKISKPFAVVNDIGAVAAPFLLTNKLVVIDDIERKHKDLDVDEILGFIDQYSQTNDTRFLLILNTDKLANRDLRDELREKVIDQELQLRTTPAEAFDIANCDIEVLYPDQIKKAVELCGICNIRIIQKILRAIALIFGKRKNLREGVLARVVPSTVLLSAIHFKGIEDGPSMDYVLAWGNDTAQWAFLDQSMSQDTDPTERAWGQLIANLGIVNCDRYERVLRDFLESGLLDPTAIAEIVERYDRDADRTAVTIRFNDFSSRFVWDHRVPFAQLLEEAMSLAEKVDLLDPQQISSLAERMLSLPGGAEPAQNAMQAWLDDFRKKHPDGITIEDEPLWGGFRQEIREGLLAMRKDGPGTMSVLDATISMYEKSGWGSREEAAFQSSSIEEFEDILRNSENRKFQLFMHQIMQFVAYPDNYNSSIRGGAERFVEACRKVRQDPEAARLNTLVEELFRNAGQLPLLQPPAPVTGPID